MLFAQTLRQNEIAVEVVSGVLIVWWKEPGEIKGEVLTAHRLGALILGSIIEQGKQHAHMAPGRYKESVIIHAANVQAMKELLIKISEEEISTRLIENIEFRYIRKE